MYKFQSHDRLMISEATAQRRRKQEGEYRAGREASDSPRRRVDRARAEAMPSCGPTARIGRDESEVEARRRRVRPAQDRRIL